ncbi:unnamed protein product [Brassica rapa subsp. trilocularis]|uniref:(rape) hypothetical protein n=1 Tax=Brassica napus TaxID=3708 RepID=A0A816TUY3_BRANA|nr:unnamed protein product [Brassica napus]
MKRSRSHLRNGKMEMAKIARSSSRQMRVKIARSSSRQMRVMQT